MRHHQALSSFFALSLVALATFSVKAAHADESTCQADTDCEKGWSCQVTGGSACGSPGCAPGEACDATPPCEDTVFKSCVPANCTADSDCADGMVCYQPPFACAGVMCPKDAECPPVDCDPGPKQCTPKYQVPCTKDADCGAGFDCTFGEVCVGGTTAVDAGAPDTPSDPGTAGTAGSANPGSTTSCAPVTVGSCHVTPVSCEHDADCQTGWTCLDANPNIGCAEASPPAQGSGAGSNLDGGTPAPSADAGSQAPSDGSTGTGCPPPPAPKLQCTPPGYSYGYDASAGVGSPTSNASGGAGSGLGATPTTPERGATDASGTASPATSTSCSVSIPGGSSNRGFALLALGLFGFVRRRRTTART